ncbi:UNVERIFIED_CONTAM: hypothetical protein GTU68_014758 [Idotea baltica]|nr:hypothetical protein [Idotea baltica]
MVRETFLSPKDFIAPLFIRHGFDEKRPISSMPGQFQWSEDRVIEEVGELAERGINSVLLFGIPSKKDAVGSDNFSPEGVVPSAIRKIKDEFPDMIVISDMCCCEYTDHGHCGILPSGYLLNDESLEIIAKASIIHAQAGADMIAPSGMLDGMVRSIRTALDSESMQHISIMSYAVKYASSFYGPFREAAEGAPSFGDRSSYQMDPANSKEAIIEALLDIEEGADIIMVKPALAYLDIIAKLDEKISNPLAAYQVSGEFSMIHAAAEKGWLSLEACALESLLSIKRSGASLIASYFAKDAADWLSN